jgi:hypothetical protein
LIAQPGTISVKQASLFLTRDRAGTGTSLLVDKVRWIITVTNGHVRSLRDRATRRVRRLPTEKRRSDVCFRMGKLGIVAGATERGRNRDLSLRPLTGI